MSRSPKVLIVDDDATIAHDIKLRLLSSGFTVIGTAQTGTEALEQIEEIQPDIVLMDIRLKGKVDGLQTAQIVKDRYSLPIIFLTTHADDLTLEPARTSEPLGAIVKPIGNTNMKAMIKMVLQRHRVKRELEKRIKKLSSLLHKLPDAVVVTDAEGEVLLLNAAAERLTGWTNVECMGGELTKILRIEDASGDLVTEELFELALLQNETVRILRDSTLVMRDGKRVEVTGQLAATPGNKPTAGVFITLHDMTAQNGEAQRLAQERQIFLAGEFAWCVAREFSGLFDLLQDCCEDMSESTEKNQADLILRASQLGKGMAIQLMDFRDSYGAAHAINVEEFLEGSSSLLKRLCEKHCRLEIITSDVGYVLSTGDHFEHMLMHLVLQARHRLRNGGTIRLSTDVQMKSMNCLRSKSYVRICVEATSDYSRCGENSDILTLDEEPEVSTPIIHALASSAGGFTTERQYGETIEVEVFLRRHESGASAKTFSGQSKVVVMAVGLGLEPRLMAAVKRAAGEDALILEAQSLSLATFVCELYPGDIDLLIVNEQSELVTSNGCACEQIVARRPKTVLLSVNSYAGGAEEVDPAEFERNVQQVLKKRQIPMMARAQNSGNR